MNKFYTLKINDLKRETADCVSIAFDIPNELKTKFQFKPGQHITTKAIIDGEDIRRSYSLCTSPDETDYRVAIKQVENGKFSTFANNEIKTGDSMEVMPPSGHFFAKIDANHAKKYVGFGGGSGITPLMSIIKSVLVHEPNSTFTLIYTNRNEASIIFNSELKALEAKYAERLKVYHVLENGNSNTDYSGYLSQEKIQKYSNSIFNKNEINEYFLCGPAPMLDVVTAALESLDIPKEKVRLELFTAADSVENDSNSVEHEIVSSEITVIVDGDEYTFQLDTNESILDAAEKEDIDVPFACKGGVCSTCKAKVEEGEVRMDKNYALEPEELENNYVLTCQAHPVTDKVVLDFDII